MFVLIGISLNLGFEIPDAQSDASVIAKYAPGSFEEECNNERLVFVRSNRQLMDIFCANRSPGKEYLFAQTEAESIGRIYAVYAHDP